MKDENTNVIVDAIRTLRSLYVKLDSVHDDLSDTLEEMPEDDDDLREPVEKQIDNLHDALGCIDQAEMYLKAVLE